MELNNAVFGTIPYSQEEYEFMANQLALPLAEEDKSERPGPSNTRLKYLESWKAIEIANRIFGFNGWSSKIISVNTEFCTNINGKWRVASSATVRIILKDGTFHDDVGFGTKDDNNQGIALENSRKEAVSDARKRALRVFGNALGNKLYDRDPNGLKKAKAQQQQQPQQQQHSKPPASYNSKPPAQQLYQQPPPQDADPMGDFSFD